MSKKILFINQEIAPYVPESEMALLGQQLPEYIQGKGCEIRTFTPKGGIINERRGQLHEVIRLSGLNIGVGGFDHPLLIKVASIPVSRVQVYFIDNDEYFHKRKMALDDEGKEYADNGQRAIFFARGVLETVKKLRWTPDVIVCQGWMAAVVPVFVKYAYNEEPCFANTKIVTNIFEKSIKGEFVSNMKECIEFQNANYEVLAPYNDQFDMAELLKLAIDNSDAVCVASAAADEQTVAYAKTKGVPVLDYSPENNAETYHNFFENI